MAGMAQPASRLPMPFSSGYVGGGYKPPGPKTMHSGLMRFDAIKHGWGLAKYVTPVATSGEGSERLRRHLRIHAHSESKRWPFDKPETRGESRQSHFAAPLNRGG
ncbi:hypothetical protein CCP1ISM_710002 [Azospirillaceae bacterium]